MTLKVYHVSWIWIKRNLGYKFHLILKYSVSGLRSIFLPSHYESPVSTEVFNQDLSTRTAVILRAQINDQKQKQLLQNAQVRWHWYSRGSDLPVPTYLALFSLFSHGALSAPHVIQTSPPSLTCQHHCWLHLASSKLFFLPCFHPQNTGSEVK